MHGLLLISELDQLAGDLSLLVLAVEEVAFGVANARLRVNAPVAYVLVVVARSFGDAGGEGDSLVVDCADGVAVAAGLGEVGLGA